MMYSWYAKNYGKDLILSNRLKIAKKLKITGKTAKMFSYLMNAELDIILQ